MQHKPLQMYSFNQLAVKAHNLFFCEFETDIINNQKAELICESPAL